MAGDQGEWLPSAVDGLQADGLSGPGPADRPQLELNRFLQLELCHSLGAYSHAAYGMRQLQNRMAARKANSPWRALLPADALNRMVDYNENLRANLHLPAPNGASSPLINAQPAAQHPDPGSELGSCSTRTKWVCDFYYSTVIALEFATKRRDDQPTESQAELGRALQIIHDARRRGRREGSEDVLAQARIHRNRARLKSAVETLKPARLDDRAADIIGDHLEAGGVDATQLHTHVLGALIEGHIRMHRAEHLLSYAFGEKMRRRAEIDEMCEQELRRSLVLNTFAYAASRTAQWIFAARNEEREEVLASYDECCASLSPTYTIWLAKQVSLLALHRRAYTWYLLDEGEKAHNDFQKLKRFARELERQFEDRILQPAGAHIFLCGLSASADHHTGRLYRVNHAHPAALRHFDRAVRQVERLEDDCEARTILRNSRWRVQLLINRGKASYELGLTKQTLMCHALALRAFFELAETESHPRANLTSVNNAIAWLESVETDAEVSKSALAHAFGPIVTQLKIVSGPRHLRSLIAEILTRLAHVLFSLKLSPAAHEHSGSADETVVEEHELAYACLQQAALLDPSRTLIAADLIKIERAQGTSQSDASAKMASLELQRPGGGGSFEEAARVIEYVLHCWLRESTPGEVNERKLMARELLGSFLAHTDSMNVKYAQIYRYLMKPETHTHDYSAPGRVGDNASALVERGSRTAWLEFVCLRRYSSFYPFVPRPMAFPALGGGYFVRVHERRIKARGKSHKVFGIAVDPGPDFIDNLYRSGYCVADIHMIVVTHDHADHVAALDALLALMVQRGLLGASTFAGSMPVIVGNESVFEQYQFLDDFNLVRVRTFEQWEDAWSDGRGGIDGARMPLRCLRIERVATFAHRDTRRSAAQGFLLSARGDRGEVAILFAGDTGPFGEEEISKRVDPARAADAVRSGGMHMQVAITRADVVVAHVSSIPVPQLRVLAQLDESSRDGSAESNQFNELWTALARQIAERRESSGEFAQNWVEKYTFLLRQLQFGFHSRPVKTEPEGLAVSPLSRPKELKPPSLSHLYLDGLSWVAERLRESGENRLLLVGELHEELGMFRTQIASALNRFIFGGQGTQALTADIGLTVRLRPGYENEEGATTEILCSTCALDNDLIDSEQFHAPSDVYEVCVKGENEGVFYNCEMHDPLHMPEPTWVERMERYDPFGR